jgi:hypothetical protein
MAWLVALFLLCVGPAHAANVSLSLGVSELEVGQSTKITVVVVGEQPLAIPAFEPIEGIDIRFEGRRSEFQSTPSTGIVRTYRFHYDLRPRAVGSYEVGPVEVALRGGAEQAGPVGLTVVPRSEKAAAMVPLRATSEFRRTDVWEGEVVLYDAELTARVPIRDVRWRFPEFEGLQVPSDVNAQTTTTRIGDPAGDITVVKTVVPLIAAGTGDRTQSPAIAQVSRIRDRRSVFGMAVTKTEQEVATQAPLTIRPLPPAPDGFSGVVGRFRIQSALEKTDRIKVGESVGWTVTVLGDGVLDGFELPELEGLDGVRVYRDSSSVVGGMDDGTYIARKAFSMVLVPTERGVHELPDLSIVFFDPVAGRYVTETVELGTLSVMGVGTTLDLQDFADPDAAVDPEEVETIDLVEVFTWGAATTPPLAPVLPFALLVALAPGGLVLGADGVRAVRRWWRNRVTPTVEVRGRGRLANPPRDPVEQLAVCDLALREVLADRVGVPVPALDRDQALSTLPRPVARDVRQAFTGLDRARFAGGPVPPDAVIRVKQAIESLEKAA